MEIKSMCPNPKKTNLKSEDGFPNVIVSQLAGPIAGADRIQLPSEKI
jgi:hypothetical protein